MSNDHWVVASLKVLTGFMAEHPILTFFIVLLVCDCISDLFKAIGGKG